MKLRPLKSYTLLEILVVIAIIIILITLLFTGFTQVKEMAKRMNCLNKVKDIAQSQVGYANETGRIPTAQTYASERDLSESDAEKQMKTMGVSAYMALLIYQGVGSYKEYADQVVNGDKGKPREEYWSFVCENAAASWCSKGYSQASTYGYATTDVRAKKARLTTYSIGFLGNFDYCNDGARSIQLSVVKNNAITGKPQVRKEHFNQLLPSDVKEPHERVYVMEGGEQENENNYHELKRLAYGREIKGGLPYDASVGGATSDGTGYMSGSGAAGIGRESREKGGFNSDVTSKPNFAEIEQDVMEGRHGGYVMHGFFDGSARAISADIVGSNQFGSDLTTKDTNGRDVVKKSEVTGLYRSALQGGGDGED